jgi:hypothetical protein
MAKKTASYFDMAIKNERHIDVTNKNQHHRTITGLIKFDYFRNMRGAMLEIMNNMDDPYQSYVHLDLVDRTPGLIHIHRVSADDYWYRNDHRESMWLYLVLIATTLWVIWIWSVI